MGLVPKRSKTDTIIRTLFPDAKKIQQTEQPENESSSSIDTMRFIRSGVCCSFSGGMLTHRDIVCS